jgi:outer membrane protein OmpA-like peptidoglycan-associated protein
VPIKHSYSPVLQAWRNLKSPEYLLFLYLELSMQIKQLSLAVAAVLVSAPLFAQQPAPQPAMQGTYGLAQEADVPPAKRNADQWMAAMGDFTKNSQAFKDPQVFLSWVNAMTDPSIVAAMADAGLEPGNWLRMMTSMMQPAAVNNYAQFMLDPAIYARWATAMLDPMWYTKMITSMTNPSKIMGWMTLPMDQRLMATSMKMLDPNLYMRFMMMPMDPRGMSLMFAPMNPQLYGSMMGGLVSPQLVGGANSTWGTFMYPKQPVVALQPPAPLTLPINLLDPSTYGNVLGIIPGLPSLPAGFPSLPSMPAGFPFAGMTAAAPAMAGGAVAAAPAGFANMAGAVAATPAAFAIKAGVASTMTLGGDALFKTGKSSVKDLTPEGRAQLDALVAKIKAFGAIDSIKVIGHADKMGKPVANQKLSLARAKAVASYLKSKGVNAATIVTAGMGDTKPVVECDMKQAKDALKACLAPNRRVDIEVVGAKK